MMIQHQLGANTIWKSTLGLVPCKSITNMDIEHMMVCIGNVNLHLERNEYVKKYLA